MSWAGPMPAKTDIYGGRSPIDIPAYSVSEAGQHLELPRSTIASWALGRNYPTSAGTGRFRPIIRLADAAEHLLSFRNLVEIHVLSALRRIHQVRLPAVRKAVDYLRRHLRSDHPLSDEQMLTDGKDLFIEQYQKLVNVSQQGQLEMKEIVAAYLQRIERDPHGLPIRLYPFTTNQLQNAPKAIVIDPRVQFGRPCIAKRGVPTAVIVSQHKAGDSIRVLAEDFGCSSSDIEEALRYEYRGAAAA